MPASQVLFTEVELTNAQIKTIPSTPVEMVPAAGAGKIISFQQSEMLLDATGGVYTGIGLTSQLEFRTGGVRQSNAFDEVDQGAFVDASGVHLLRIPPPTSNNAGVTSGIWLGDVSAVTNQPLMLHWNNDGATDLMGGNAANSLKITIFYSIIEV